MDRYSRTIVGWSLEDTMTTGLAENAFRSAVLARKPAFGLPYHSDRGVQDTNGRCRRMLARQGAHARLSRRGNCHDDAVVE